MSKSFRGFLASFKKRFSSAEPRLDGLTFTIKESTVPSSSEYTLEGVLAAGTPISAVNTEVLHDSSAIDYIVNNNQIDSPALASNVNNNQN